MSMRYLQCPEVDGAPPIEAFEIRAAKTKADLKEISFTGWASTPHVDLYNDSIRTQAWEDGGLDDYLKNPVYLYCHWSEMVIGLTRELKVVPGKGLKNTTDIRLTAKVSDMILEEWEAGLLRGQSVGFVPLERSWKLRCDDEDEDHPKKDKDGDPIEMLGKYGQDIHKAHLVEISLTPIPANPKALITLNSTVKKAAMQMGDVREALRRPSMVVKCIPWDSQEIQEVELLTRDLARDDSPLEVKSEGIDIDVLLPAPPEHLEKARAAVRSRPAGGTLEVRSTVEADRIDIDDTTCGPMEHVAPPVVTLKMSTVSTVGPPNPPQTVISVGDVPSRTWTTTETLPAVTDGVEVPSPLSVEEVKAVLLPLPDPWSSLEVGETLRDLPQKDLTHLVQDDRGNWFFKVAGQDAEDLSIKLDPQAIKLSMAQVFGPLDGLEAHAKQAAYELLTKLYCRAGIPLPSATEGELVPGQTTFGSVAFQSDERQLYLDWRIGCSCRGLTSALRAKIKDAQTYDESTGNDPVDCFVALWQTFDDSLQAKAVEALAALDPQPAEAETQEESGSHQLDLLESLGIHLDEADAAEYVEILHAAIDEDPSIIEKILELAAAGKTIKELIDG